MSNQLSPDEQVNQLIIEGIFQALKRLGALDSMADWCDLQELRNQINVKHKYSRLWDEMMQILLRYKKIEAEGKQIRLTETSDILKSQISSIDLDKEAEKLYQACPRLKYQLELLVPCLKELSEILLGRKQSTEVIFAHSSMERVEAIYKSHPSAEYFNLRVADVVTAAVQQALSVGFGGKKINILEIGAGTGGTSTFLFEALNDYSAHLRYIYTDISKRFLIHADETFCKQYGFVETQLLNIEQAVTEQGFEIGTIDIVVAANVLHATRNISTTLRHVRTLLKDDGLLVLNELTEVSPFLTMTFGLLDGWWLYEDETIRLPGSPALSPQNWQLMLEKEHFHAVNFLDDQARVLGQQIIIAQSNSKILDESLVTPKVVGATNPTKQEKPKQYLTTEIATLVEAKLIEQLSQCIKINPSRLNTYTTFSDYGVDSILMLAFVDQINRELGIELNPSELFNYTTVERLTQFIVEQYGEQITTTQPVAIEENKIEIREEKTVLNPDKNSNSNKLLSHSSVSDTNNKSNNEVPDIAIIGMSGQFPGATNIQQFWQNLQAGIDSVSELPESRLKRQLYSPQPEAGKCYCKWGGILEEQAYFDPLFFEISPKEAAQMNPSQRLFMQESYRALEDAGIVNENLANLYCGIYVGCEPNGYSKESFTGSSEAIVASRISYFLNLQGPALVINSGCSSSLVAIHLACESLRHGENDIALAGGVFTNLNSELLTCLSSVEMLSASGKCRTFDTAADGTILAEGVCVVVLKRLPDALNDGDLIYGVIKGSGINQDGRSNGITAPNGLAQEKLIERTYQKYQIDPSKISYIEAHGTGTKLGDPVEANALKKVFSSIKPNLDFRCGIGSVKANIGHTAAAAGAIGLAKVLLCLKHRQLPGLVHFDKLNPLINFQSTGLYIVQHLQEWKANPGAPLMAGINSFGHSGTNAHLVVQEAPLQPIRDVVAKPFYLICLSAKTDAALQQKISDLSEYLARQEEPGNLGAIAYTLNTGRAHFKKRCALVVDSLKTLQDALTGTFSSENMGSAEKMSGTEQALCQKIFEAIATELHDTGNLANAAARSTYKNNLAALAGLYLKGFALDWEKIYQGEVYRRLSLPTYPFAQETYWIEAGNSVAKERKDQGLIAMSTATDQATVVGQFYLPEWQPLVSTGATAPLSDRPKLTRPSFAGSTGKPTVIIFYPGTMTQIKDGLKNYYEQTTTTQVLSFAVGDSSLSELNVGDKSAFKLALASLNLLEQNLALTIYWIMPTPEPLPGIGLTLPASELNLEHLEKNQSLGLIALFRLVQALLGYHCDSQELTLKVVTQQTQVCQASEKVAPFGADVVGFVQSLGQEYPFWQISCVDINQQTKWTAEQTQNFVRELVPLNPPTDSTLLCWREPYFYQRKLTQIQLAQTKESSFKNHGVYLIIGGAGGLGLTLSQHLLKTVQAKLIWVGRRNIEALHPEALHLLRSRGAEILYQQADLSDLEAMQQVVQRAKYHFGRIDGVIHSALVLADQAIADLEEQTLHKVLMPKVQGNVVLSQVLADEPLDFLLFFSAGQSFVSQPGQSNYAAACTFEDTWAQFHNQWQPYPVKTINWGYWGEVGIVANEKYRQKMAQQGVLSINPKEGMAAIERFLPSSVTQVGYFKMQPSTLEPSKHDQTPNLHEPIPPSSSGSAAIMDAVITATQGHSISEAEGKRYQQALKQLERLGCYLLLRTFQTMGVFNQPGELYEQQELANRLGIIRSYERLYQEWLNLLEKAGFIQLKGSQIQVTNTLEPESEEEQNWLKPYPELAAHEKLLRICLQSSPDIVRGRILATDIIFPEASMELVKDIYQGNPATDALNRKAREAVVAYIKTRLANSQEQLSSRDAEKIVFLEVGAGTGGMSKEVLRGLAPYQEHIEYYYTDISEHFLQYGRRHYGTEYPFVRFQILDIEQGQKNLSDGLLGNREQAIGKIPNVDVVLAANVLHATKSIRQTVQQVKALLKRNGLLILNEITTLESFATLTFGLLDGWWLSSDSEMRLPGGPLLSESMWHCLLEQEGFDNVVSLGEQWEGEILRQHIIVGQTSGDRLTNPQLDRTRNARRETSPQQGEPVQLSSHPQPPAARQQSRTPKASTVQLLKKVQAEIVETLAENLDLASGRVELDVPFSQYGVDSILSVSIVNQLNQRLGIRLQRPDLFNYTTTESLAVHIVEKFGDTQLKIGNPQPRTEGIGNVGAVPPLLPREQENEQPETLKQPTSPATPSPHHSRIPIAVIGISACVPGADNIYTFWDNLLAGKNSVTQISPERRKREIVNEAQEGPDSAKRRAGFMDNIAEFDPLFFAISPQEAEWMDPTQRLFLQQAWLALEDAGYNPQSLKGSSCAVFVGCSATGYGVKESEQAGYVPYSMTNSSAILPARVSYFLDLKGPSIPINTACSSSLVAIHLACEQLRSGQSQIALAGGASALIGSALHIGLNGAGMLSPDGLCKTFDRQANGFVLGEAVGVVVLKPLSQALADGDSIYGLIIGSGINQDGKTNGIMAPNGPSQTALIESVYRQFEIDPNTITYLEAHGTGTQLGDPIEVNALDAAYKKFTSQTQYCALGSVKTNIGHTNTAAGVCSLIKTLLCLKHRKLVPSLHYQEPNENIEFAQTPFYINTEVKDWAGDKNGKRRAAVSSFGYSGTNAHLVLEEFEDTRIGSLKQQDPALIILSAKNEERLRNLASNLRAYLQRQVNENSQIQLADVAYTLQVGRQAMSERLAFVADSLTDLLRHLTNFVDGQAQGRELYRGKVKSAEDKSEFLLSGEAGQAFIDTLIKQRDYRKLAELWVTGTLSLDWNLSHGENRPRRISLPGYAFARESYWLSGVEAKGESLTKEEIREKTPIIGSSHHSELMTFEEVWRQTPLQETKACFPNKKVIYFLSRPENQQAMLESMQAIDPTIKVIFIAQGDAFAKLSSHTYTVDPADSQSYHQALTEIGQNHGQVEALFYLWAAEDSRCLSNSAPIVHILQALTRSLLKPSYFLLVAPFSTGIERCYLESWIGFERSLKLIMPDLQVAGVYQEKSTPEQTISMAHWSQIIFSELKTSSKLQTVIFQKEQRYVCQIQKTELATEDVSVSSAIKPGGTYLITGGCGGLGFLVAQHLTKQVTSATNSMLDPGINLILIGRSPLNAKIQDQLTRLEKLGAKVEYIQADLSQAIMIETGIAQAKKRFGSINGIFHIAGIAASASILDKDIPAFERVIAPKIAGTLLLDELCKDEPLDFVCYFSSSAAILGDFGACDYAIGNRFQMAFAAYRNQLLGGAQNLHPLRQGKALVINWPLWREGGMGFNSDENTKMYLQSSGQQVLETDVGLAILDKILRQNKTQHLVLVGQPKRIERFLGLNQPPVNPSPVNPSPAKRKATRPELTGLSLEQSILWDLKNIIVGQLKVPWEQLDEQSNLADFGFDSISLLTFAKRLSQHYQLEITPALFFGYSTLEQLTQYFLSKHLDLIQAFYQEPAPTEEHFPQVSPPESTASLSWPTGEHSRPNREEAAPPEKSDNALEEPIAIIGMSGRFPQAYDVEQMWNILVEGESAIAEIPPNYFDWRKYYGDPSQNTNKTNGKWCGCIPGVAEFDPLFFQISPREAANIDPRQRHLLQESWNALENAGYGPEQINNQKIGTFVGAEEGDYCQRVKEGNITSNHLGILAARLAYFLNLKGPTMVINTACSSSLVAVHQACLSLRQGECDTALAAGVNLMLTPYGYISMAQAGMLSQDGCCYAFDRRANGLVPGEAVVVVVLKRLSRALTDGDPIQGLILASGINHDGKTNGITAPNGVSQTELVKDVYQRARINPQEIDYIVTHGTGTKLGDPVEINALNEVFKDSEHPCAISSTKTNFGHTFAASGLVSLVSLVQSLRHETIPKSLNFAQPNEFIGWEQSPLYVNQANKPWTDQPGKKRLGAVSSFGMSGTNAHLVVQGRPFTLAGSPLEQPSLTAPYFLLVLSAKTEEALQEKVKAMIAFLVGGLVDHATLEDVSYTLFTGRHHFQYRLAIVVQDIAEAIYSWKQLGNPDRKPHIFQSKVPAEFKGQKVIQNYIDDLLRKISLSSGKDDQYRENLFGLADFYCQGYEIPWHTRYGQASPRRIILPGYPFSRQHFWLDFSPQEPQIAELPKKLGQDLGYLLQWEQQKPITDKINQTVNQVVLLVYFGSLSPFAKTLVHFLEQQCHSRVIEIQLAQETKQVSEDKWYCDVKEAAGFSTCFPGFFPAINGVYFLCCDPHQDGGETREIQLLRLVKAIKEKMPDNAFIDFTLLTLDNYRVDDSATSPDNGGISGLGYSIAQGDHRFRVRNIDLSWEDLASNLQRQALPALILKEPATDRGEVTKLQAGLRYKQRFFKLDWQSLQQATSQVVGLETGGVYVLLGGAGTVGAIITRYLIQQYQAKVVWLGRRASTSPTVQEKLNAFEVVTPGNVPLYFQADATDPSSIAQAIAQIKQHHPRINGAIFAPMVFKFDNSIAQTSEADFNEVLEPKKKGAHYFYRAFQHEALDFMCYFSSVQSFSFLSSRDSAGYAAGITSADTFVHSIASSAAFPVGMINWGYWQASIAGTQAEKRLAGHYDLISDGDGCQFFAEFVSLLRSGIVRQALCLGASKAVENLMGCDRTQMITLNQPDADSLIHCLFDEQEQGTNEDGEITRLLARDFREELDNWLVRLLFSQMQQLGIFFNQGEQKDSILWQQQAGVLEKYGRWWRECCLGLLENSGYVQCQGQQVKVTLNTKVEEAARLWQDWENYQNLFREQPDKKAALELLDSCLRQLPQILRGQIQATDILFPKSSLEKVEKMYQRNALSDYFNAFVAKAAANYIRRRLEVNPQTRIRILEIGAGTGGTTALVLPQLCEVQHAIDEYCYTDLSQAFLKYAEKTYRADYPYLNCKILDVEQSLTSQGIAPGAYDLVIATNVLHATKNIRKTLHHAKTALKRHGLLLLNEVVAKSIIGTLTFGLLDGWWLYQDEELRIPGSPLLDLECWLKVLREGGFASTLLPARFASELGQQVIVAESDGLVKQQREQLPKQQNLGEGKIETKLPQNKTLKVTQNITTQDLGTDRVKSELPVAQRELTTEAMGEYVSKVILQYLSQTLDLSQENIDPQVSFSDYGIDSILGVGFIDKIGQELGIKLNTAILFDYTNINRLSHYLVDAYTGVIQTKLLENKILTVSQKITTPNIGTDRVKSEIPVAQQELTTEAMGEYVAKVILQYLSQTLDLSQENIDPQVSFSDYGIDSILGVGFIDKIGQELGIKLNTAILFDYTNINRLSHYLVDAYTGVIQTKLLENKILTVSQKITTPNIGTDRVKSEIPVAQQELTTEAMGEYVSKVILQYLSQTLDLSQENIDPQVSFSDYGIDSILGVGFIDKIGQELGIKLNTAILFDYTNINRLSHYLVDAYTGVIQTKLLHNGQNNINTNTKGDNQLENKQENLNSQGTSSQNTSVIDKEIAVIGMSGQFPGAKDIDTFWQNLIQGKDGVAELPSNYLNPDLFSPHKQVGKTDCKWGGILEERDCFDPLFFNINPREAESMNPHQRLVLSESWKALEDAGYNPKTLENSRVSVFIGAEPTDYVHETFTGSSDALVSSRLSYYLNLKGPALVVNTGCSSSGLAIHLACESLRAGESTMALAGGIFAILQAKALVKLAQIDMLSSTGRCRTFDKSCDGTVLSEGVGIVLLKRLNDAIRDKDPIYGVIQASGANQDGASNGITAPSGLSQEELLVSVYRQYQINPERISYFEAHGTGTPLGDTVEANALKRAFKQFTNKTQFCALGSAKSHIGHTGAASGVIGLIKILLSMHHRQLPKLLHFEELNPAIELANSAFYVNKQQVEWKSNDGPLTAGLNSFGHSGTNVHLVIREHLSIPPVKVAADAVLIPLSAKTPECLKSYGAKLAAFLENKSVGKTTDTAISLTDLAFTFQLGREAMRERCIFLTTNIPDLIAQLNAFAQDGTLTNLSWQGRVTQSKHHSILADDESKSMISQWIQTGNLEKVAAAWVQGTNIDWSAFYPNLKPQKIHAPTYPFAREHYWKPESEELSDKPASQATKTSNGSEKNPANFGTLMLQPHWLEQTTGSLL